MTPEELAAAYPFGSRWKNKGGGQCTVTGYSGCFIIVDWDDGPYGVPWSSDGLAQVNWTRIDAPKPEAAKPKGEYKGKYLDLQGVEREMWVVPNPWVLKHEPRYNTPEEGRYNKAAELARTIGTAFTAGEGGWRVRDNLLDAAAVLEVHASKLPVPSHIQAKADAIRQAAAELTALHAKVAELEAILGGIKWQSADRDNMEFAARITYSQMDAIRAMKGTTDGTS
jgi:hypothetical protein